MKKKVIIIHEELALTIMRIKSLLLYNGGRGVYVWSSGILCDVYVSLIIAIGH